MQLHKDGQSTALIDSRIPLGGFPAAIGSLVSRGTVGKVIAVP